MPGRRRRTPPAEPSAAGDRSPRRAGHPRTTRTPPGGAPVESMRARTWCARACLALVVGAFVVLLAFAGRRGLWLVLLTAATAVVVVAALFWFLRQRGPLRWLALGLAV